jgi:hypothetical protein
VLGECRELGRGAQLSSSAAVPAQVLKVLGLAGSAAEQQQEAAAAEAGGQAAYSGESEEEEEGAAGVSDGEVGCRPWCHMCHGLAVHGQPRCTRQHGSGVAAAPRFGLITYSGPMPAVQSLPPTQHPPHTPPLQVDLEDLGGPVGKRGAAGPASGSGRREMVTPVVRASLTKQGYKVLGSHSGVKMCRCGGAWGS